MCVRIERKSGPIRLACLPAEKQPVVFGLHSSVAERYKVAPDKFPPRAQHSTMLSPLPVAD